LVLAEKNSQKRVRVLKSNNRYQRFNEDKIITSLMNVGASSKTAARIAKELSDTAYDGIPTREIRKKAYKLLAKKNRETAKRYMYRMRMRVRTSKTTLEPFKKESITRSLTKETNLNKEIASDIAHQVEKEIGRMRLNYVTAPLIREMVNVKLIERGLENTRARYTRLGMPVYDVKNLIEHKTELNSKIQFNPEAVHKFMADQISREYALVNILPLDLADAHMGGELHIHGIDYFATRPFCFSHDLRFFLKNGLLADGVGEYTAVAGPAKNPEVAFLHAAKVLAASQLNCSSGQGLIFFNTFLAPYVRGLSAKKIRQLVQMFVFELNQMYVARGGRRVSSSVCCYSHIPDCLSDVPAVQPGGVVKKSATYSNYGGEANAILSAILDVLLEGDFTGRPFKFPGVDLHLNGSRIPRKFFELTSKFRVPYVAFHREYLPKNPVYARHSYLLPTHHKTKRDLKAGTMRGGILQAVTLNLPQISYETNGNEKQLFELLGNRLGKAVNILLLKKQIIEDNLENGLLPFFSQRIGDGKKTYLDVERMGLSISFIGLSEMVKSHTGEHIHESKSSQGLALNTIQFLSDRIKSLRKETGLPVMLAAPDNGKLLNRLAKIDRIRYGDRAEYCCKKDEIQYTSSFHLPEDAELSPWERLRIEERFHPHLLGGALSNIYSEGELSTSYVSSMIRKIRSKTDIQYARFL